MIVVQGVWSVGVTSVSNNVGGVKHVLRTLLHALIEERHFALSVV